MVFRNRNVIYGMLVGVLVIGAVSAFFLIRGKESETSFRPQPERVHAYQRPEIDISNIQLKVFYAAPSNKTKNLDPSWKMSVENALNGAVRFHELEFRGKSKVSYDVFPEPVILEHENLFYDTQNTGAGNPRALVSIAEELNRRVFKESGDLFNGEFVRFAPSAYRAMAIIYEGVGAAGGVIYESDSKTVSDIAKEFNVPESIVFITDVDAVDGFLILNRDFLVLPDYRPFGAALFYHEFGHIIGFPDLYDATSGRPFSDGIMGLGRNKPIDFTFIEPELLKGVGL